MPEINPTHRYVVHADVAMPEPAKKVPRDDDNRWPFEIMEVGDSFDEPNPGDFDRCRLKASLHGYHNDRKYATRIMRANAQMNCPVCDTAWPVPPQFVIRVWRTA